MKTEGTRVLEEQRRSGKSVARFAKARGLVPERLYWWQRKLTRGGAQYVPRRTPGGAVAANLAGRPG